MHIVNCMLSRGHGGIEQAFLDYDAALRLAGHRVTPVIYPQSWAHRHLSPANASDAFPLPNWGRWDLYAAHRLRRHFAAIRPDAIICHGNRAISLCSAAADERMPVIGVAHNYLIKHFPKLTAAFAITHDLVEKLAETGMKRERIFHIPNMVALREAAPARPWRNPPVIGAMGRFVAKKGFDIFLDALALLRQEGLAFQAILAGDGEISETLKQQAARLELNGCVTFPGWAEDKYAFYREIDLFCVPSLHEPFGIVLLEAFNANVPVIATDSEGPREIITSGHDGLLVPVGDAQALSTALAGLLNDPARAKAMAQTAHKTLESRYALPAVAEKISATLLAICGR